MSGYTSSPGQVTVPRSEVRKLACPECGAIPGNACVKWSRRAKAYKTRISNHSERVLLAVRTLS